MILLPVQHLEAGCSSLMAPMSTTITCRTSSMTMAGAVPTDHCRPSSAGSDCRSTPASRYPATGAADWHCCCTMLMSLCSWPDRRLGVCCICCTPCLACLQVTLHCQRMHLFQVSTIMHVHKANTESCMFSGKLCRASIRLYLFLLACRQIQEVLVSLGDKESAFIGSNNWIGAIELSYILDEYLGITSKVGSRHCGSSALMVRA